MVTARAVLANIDGMRRLAVALVLAAALDACRDLTVPGQGMEKEGGTVYGTVVLAEPGGGYGPAAGAQVGLLGSSVSTTAGMQGDFLLDGVQVTHGNILFRYGDGSSAKQRLVRIEDIHAGPGRDIGIGEVVLSENAELHGRVLLQDHVTARGGHGGTQVFIPQSPYAGMTADDGSFAIVGLPEGHLSLSAFHAGYQSASLSEIDLRAGESFAVADLVLVPDTTSTPGAVHGHVVLQPTGSAPITVAAVDSGGLAHGVAATNGDYAITSLPPDLYSIQASAPGYATAVLPNVLVKAALDVAVPDIVVGQGGQVDAGFVAVDAGCTHCGASCATSLDCPATQWCDDHLCRPLCGSAADCGGGRACDATTHTCVTPCTSGCPVGQLCDPDRNACVPGCDLSTPCPASLHCGLAGVCVPDCLSAADCGAHQTCKAGLCANDGTCGKDSDCPPSQLCITGICSARPTAPLDDAGLIFGCSSACECKSNEVCYDGGCTPSGLTPDVMLSLASDAGALAAALRQPGVIALKGGETWVLDAGLLIPDGGVVLSGGWVACSPTRWVRDPASRTTLTNPGGTTLTVNGAGAQLRGLSFSAAPPCTPTVAGVLADGLLVDEVSLRIDFPNGCSHDLLRCDKCNGVRLDRVSFASDTVQTNGSINGVHLYNGSSSSGRLDCSGLLLQNDFTALWVDNPTGPVTVSGLAVQPPASSSRSVAVYVNDCNANPIDVENNRFAWPTSPNGSPLSVYRCPNVTVRGNTVAGGKPAANPQMSAFYLENAGGLVAGNSVMLPDVGPNAGTFGGIDVHGLYGPMTVRDNTVDGGLAATVFGVQLRNLSSGPIEVLHNDVTLKGASAYAYISDSVTASAGLHFADNRGVARGAGLCGTNAVGYDSRYQHAGVLERNALRAELASNSVALSLYSTGKQLELYDNFLFAGVPAGNCSGTAEALGTFWPSFDTINGQVFAVGNTLEAQGDRFSQLASAVNCNRELVVFMDSNLVGGTQAPVHYAVSGNGSLCFDATHWHHNYFWTASDAGEQPTDWSYGLADGGNTLGGMVSCYDPQRPASDPWRIAAGSPCVDRGSARMLDGGTLAVDLENGPRVKGAAADIGCYEAQ